MMKVVVVGGVRFKPVAKLLHQRSGTVPQPQTTGTGSFMGALSGNSKTMALWTAALFGFP